MHVCHFNVLKQAALLARYERMLEGKRNVTLKNGMIGTESVA